jgi:hypothetical protein
MKLPKAYLWFMFCLCAQAFAEVQLVPAGSIIRCVTNEGPISSRTSDVGDPVLCQIVFFDSYGHQAVPRGSFLAGAFEDYRDPGHLVGKGWMVLKFDRILIAPNLVIPIESRVVGVPQYVVDREGKIRGRGHAVRDTVLWLIPILWPIDLMNLPRRGPRPTLKAETRIQVKLMEDVEIPMFYSPVTVSSIDPGEPSKPTPQPVPVWGNTEPNGTVLSPFRRH